MRLFEHFPKEPICVVCGTNEDKPCFLMPIDNTEKGNICEATPIHADCITDRMGDFRYSRAVGVIYLDVREVAQ